MLNLLVYIIYKYVVYLPQILMIIFCWIPHFKLRSTVKTKNDVVGKLQMELSDLKKELHHRKKIIAVQQQLIHSGNESYVKVVNVRFFADFC